MQTLRRSILTLAVVGLGLTGVPVAEAQSPAGGASAAGTGIRSQPRATGVEPRPLVPDRTRTTAGTPAGTLARDPYLGGYAGPGGDDGLELVFQIPLPDPDPNDRSLFSGALALETTQEGAVFVNGGGVVLVSCIFVGCAYVPMLVDSSGTQVPVDVPATGGDTMRVTYGSDGTTARATIENLTQGGSADLSFPHFLTTDVRIGDMAVTLDGVTAEPVPFFDRHSFRPVRVDGKRISATTGLTRYTMVDQAGDPVLTAGKIRRGGFVVRNA